MKSEISTTETPKLYQPSKNEIRRSNAIQRAYRKYRREHTQLKHILAENADSDRILWQHTQVYNEKIKKIFLKYKTNDTVFLNW